MQSLDIACCTDFDALFNTRPVLRARLTTQQRLVSYVPFFGCVSGVDSLSWMSSNTTLGVGKVSIVRKMITVLTRCSSFVFELM